MSESENATVCSKKAAEMLGVSVAVLHSYAIPHKQYAPKGRRHYKHGDIKSFIAKHTFNVKDEESE
jgi:hypothetical protein